MATADTATSSIDWPRHTRRAILLIVGMVAAVFGISVTYGFVNWDDPWYVHRNPLIQSWSLENLYGICTQTVTRNFAPLTIFSYLIDFSLWRTWSGGYHLTNIVLHAANAVLVFLLVRQLTDRHVFSLLVALLFAVHPVQIESVVWISARKGLLSSLFILLSLLYWLKQDRTRRDEYLGILFFLLALFSKALAVVVPGVVFVYDWIVRRKSFSDSLSRQFIPGLLAVWFIVLTAGSQNSQTGGIRHHLGLSKLEILGLDSVLLWKYVGMMFWPTDLAILYDPPTEGMTVLTILCSLSWIALGVWLWSQRTRRPLVLFAAATALAFLVPVLNLFPLTTLMNDRYLYLSSVPFFAVMIAGVESLWRAVQERCRLQPLSFPATARIAGTVVLCYSVLSIQQLPVWRNDLALWQRAVQVSPELPVVQYQYALALWDAGEEAAAIARIQFALTLDRIDELDRERFLEKLAHFRSIRVSQQGNSVGVSSTR